jgi:hypothetical protein
MASDLEIQARYRVGVPWKGGELKGSGFAVARRRIPCSALRSSLFRLRLNDVELAGKPHQDWLWAGFAPNAACRPCTNSLRISLIQGISAETGSLETRSTANDFKATGNGGFFLCAQHGRDLRGASPRPSWPQRGK